MAIPKCNRLITVPVKEFGVILCHSIMFAVYQIHQVSTKYRLYVQVKLLNQRTECTSFANQGYGTH